MSEPPSKKQKKNMERKQTSSAGHGLGTRSMLPWTRTLQTGAALLRNPHYNKGLAFTQEERKTLRLEGLLPSAVDTQDAQVLRVAEILSQMHSSLEKYMYLNGLCNRNEQLFYRILRERLVELMPIIYTPTVGEACLKFGHIFQSAQGLTVNINHLGRVEEILRNWPETSVRGIVVTDGERILGLGDLGACGMGIPIGKAALYTACAGVDPRWMLPVTLDVGTENKTLMADPLYTGLKQARVRGDAYDQLVEEFITAALHVYGPRTLIQFEDFGNRNAMRLLEKYRDRCTTFNDDIQGTASVVLGGVMAANRITGMRMTDHMFLIFGAGEAGLGIANLLAYAIHIASEGELSEEKARKQVFLVDSRGLITKDRPSGGISSHKAPFAHNISHQGPGLEDIVKRVKPTALFGVTAQPGSFTKGVCTAMCANAPRPLIFPLSNPTSKAECTAEQAYSWTEGKCIFASGSPFDPVTIKSKTFHPGQGNNAYIFPGVALGVMVAGATVVTDKIFYVAAKTLAEQVSQELIDQGRCYPPLETILDVSTCIAAAVAEELYDTGVATLLPKPEDMLVAMKDAMYTPDYPLFC